MKKYFVVGEGRKRPVALLDADHTLVYTISADTSHKSIDTKDEGVGVDIYYLDLLSDLKAKGIRDIYLFTDMIFSPNIIADRMRMIRFLIDQGFNFLGVITPNDYFWKFNPERLQEFQAALGAANVIMNEFSQKNLDKIPGILESFPDIAAQVKNSDYPDIGHAFNEVSRSGVLDNIDRMKEINLHSIACKTAIDIITYLKGLESCKAVMLLQFLAHKPCFVSSCYVFDDIKRNLTAIDQCEHNLFPVHTVYGSFPVKHESLIANFIFHPEELSVEARLGNVVLAAFEEIVFLQNNRTLGAVFYKKEAKLALALLTKIKACDDTFEAEWAIILENFQNIPIGFFGSHQLTSFDISLLQLIAADEVICNKVGVKPQKFNRKEDPQNFLERVLSTEPQAHPHTEVKSLHSSHVGDMKLPIHRSSGNIGLLSSNRPLNLKGLRSKSMRPRSASEVPVPLDISLPSTKPKSASEELVNKDKLSDDTKSKSSSEDFPTLKKDYVGGIARSVSTLLKSDDTPPKVSSQSVSSSTSDEDRSSEESLTGRGF